MMRVESVKTDTPAASLLPLYACIDVYKAVKCTWLPIVATGAGIGEIPSMAEKRVAPEELVGLRADWRSEQAEVGGS